MSFRKLPFSGCYADVMFECFVTICSFDPMFSGVHGWDAVSVVLVVTAVRVSGGSCQTCHSILPGTVYTHLSLVVKHCCLPKTSFHNLNKFYLIF